MVLERYHELVGLPLLLFGNGRVGTYGRDAAVIAQPAQQRLLPSLAPLMLDALCAAEIQACGLTGSMMIALLKVNIIRTEISVKRQNMIMFKYFLFYSTLKM